MTAIGPFEVTPEAWKYTPTKALLARSFVADEPERGLGPVRLRHGGRSVDVARASDVVGGAHERWLERFSSADGATGEALCTARSRGQIDADASLEHVVVQDEADGASHLHRIEVVVGRRARYRLVSVQCGASLARIEVVVSLAEGATAELFGLALGSGSRHVDHHVTVQHIAPNATSRQLFRSVLDDRSRGVFTGRVVVAPGADGTDAAQSCKALLLSDLAVANARPQLEIRADDVKCAHGAAVGRPDGDVLFYLRQRGLDEALARRLIVIGFAAEVLAAVPEGLRSEVDAHVPAWLRA